MITPASRQGFSSRTDPARAWLGFAGLFAGLWLTLEALPQEPARDARPQFLSDHPEWILAHTQDWGELGWDAAAHAGGQPGEPLRIGERSFAKGLGHHAHGAITVLLDGGFSAFDAEVGLQPCAAGGSVVFRAIVDGEPRFESRVLRSGDAPVPVHVEVGGAMELRLEAAEAGDGISCDMANWAEARLTRSSRPVANVEDPPVDIGRFGRVVTWDPDRSDGSRADRIQEFRAEDLFPDRDLLADADGRFAVPVAKNQNACVGLQWLNRRALREARLAFADPAQMPVIHTVRVEGWFGESAWQGQFKPLPGALDREGDALVFHPAPPTDPGGWLLTRKLRWVFPAANGVPLVRRPQAFTRSRWAVAHLVAQIAEAGRPATAEVEITNGEWLPPLAGLSLRWELRSALRLPIRYARVSLLKSDPTVIQFRLPSGAFGVAVEDVVRHGAVFVADHGLLVTTDPPGTTVAEAQQKVAASKTILQEVRQRPDQTFAQAMAVTHHAAQREGPVMLSLAGDNAKFVVERDGRVRFQTYVTTNADWFQTAGELRPEFGEKPAKSVTRHLDGGWFPAPVMTFRNAGVAYGERVFVAPGDQPGAGLARFNRPSVCVADFTLTNEQAVAVPARLALRFLVGRSSPTPASIAKVPQGWLVTGERGPFVLVTGGTSGGLVPAVEDGTISFTGALPPNGTAHYVAALRAEDEDLLSLPSVARLHASFESYWNAALAPALHIETPDPWLNDIIRSSQVRCLIAARNEADGERIAPWIAAMSYGPLESESHSIIRAMTFFGHEDFARRSLDFFIHRYNTNGFLTTGYTTFGTAWHLWTLGEHYRLHPDAAWLGRSASELARVGEWIVRQMDKTLQPAAEGRPERGLMPPGVLADWNAFAFHFANNAYHHAALRELGAILSGIHDPRGVQFTRRADELREHTLRAYRWTQARSPVVALRNGAWTPHCPSQVHSPGQLADFFPGEDAGRSWCYDVELGAHQLVPTGVLAPFDGTVEPMLNHLEDVQFLADGWFDYPAVTNQVDWFNLGGFSKVQPYYTRNAEIYALRDDVKPFLRSYFNSLAAMLNPEVLTLWEHFNHSGAWDKTHETGYFLHQTRQMLLQERGEELWLAPLIPTRWLADGMTLAVTNAPTRFGPVSYRVTSRVLSGVIEARIEPPARSAPRALVLRLRHPDGRALRAVTVNGQPHREYDAQKEVVRLLPDAARPIVLRASY